MSENLLTSLNPLYFEPGNNFDFFLKSKDMEQYKENFLSKLFLKKEEKKSLNVSYKEKILQQVFKREENLIEKISNGKKKFSFPGNKNSQWQNYYENFNKLCQEYFFSSLKNSTNSYDLFLMRIWDIIGKGGIKKEIFKDEIKKINDEEDNFVVYLNDFIKEVRIFIKNPEEQEEKFKKAEENFAKKVARQSEDIYEKIIKIFFEINKRNLIKTEKIFCVEKEELLLNKEDHWETLYQELYGETTKAKEYTFGISETKSFFNVGNVKGSFFEDFVQRKIFKEFSGGGAQKLKFNEKDQGEAPVDAYFKNFGFQLKHGTSFFKNPVEKLYFEKNETIKMSQSENFRFLQEQDWINFVTLLELNSKYNGIINNSSEIQTFLFKFEEFQLRISTNEQFRGEADALINHVFLVNDKFFPASYVLFKRYQLIKVSKKYKVKGKLNYIYRDDNWTKYYENDFNKSKNLLANIILTR